MKRIGFIGLGVMGKSMARHLVLNGLNVTIYTRTKEKADDLIREGAKWANSLKEVIEVSDIIITMLGYPSDVMKVYLGDEGLIPNGHSGQILIDMTTSEPSLAKKLYNEGEKKGISVVDAPVSGGDIGARNGTLSIMVGGDAKTYDDLKPIFDFMGTNIVYQGQAGAGQHTKMCNQIAIATNMIGVCEALVYGKRAGLTIEDVLKSISTGAAGSWSLDNLAPRMLKGDYEPGFYIKHFIKDLRIALHEAKVMGLTLPGLTLAEKMYEELSKRGEENSGTQALYTYWGNE
ncbi:NAD(P)-dependent oxidoreductase [Bacillus spongiae]|uniref:NAD(P)-dependent oxidoreductase n=1 Tax=Bacillus spongiae TaxID=2683610 RepID=A0ABU8H9Q9_9BACI